MASFIGGLIFTCPFFGGKLSCYWLSECVKKNKNGQLIGNAAQPLSSTRQLQQQIWSWLYRYTCLFPGPGQSSYFVGESRFLCNWYSGGPETNLKTQVCPLYWSKKNWEFYLSQFSGGGPTKFKSSFSKYWNWYFQWFLLIYNKISEFLKILRGRV